MANREIFFIFVLYRTPAMFLTRIKGRKSGVLLYGITPPKAHTSPDKLCEISEKSLKILRTLDIDALVVYDVQDESARTPEERPFPFTSSLDPFHYASKYLQPLAIPKIIYRPAGQFTTGELSEWLNDLKTHGFYPVFVGLPSPDSVPLTSLSTAYKLWRDEHRDHSVIGAVTIPERHAVLKDEDLRILDKMESGVSYFISQCIFNIEYTKQILEALMATCREKKKDLPTIIFTLTICGSVRTLEFMEWLGIHVPDDIKEELRVSEDPVGCSVQMAIAIAKDLIRYCLKNDVPFGFNVESVATKKEEVAASLQLLDTIAELLSENGLRTKAKEKTEHLALG